MTSFHKLTTQFLSVAVGLSLGIGASRADDFVPFKSKGEITITESIPDPEAENVFYLKGEDVGYGTHLGRYTSTYSVTVTAIFSEAGILERLDYEGEFTSTAADGSTLTMLLEVTQPLDGSGLAWSTATIIKEKGTGRFANTEGCWSSLANATETGFVYESEGSISTPGQSKRGKQK